MEHDQRAERWRRQKEAGKATAKWVPLSEEDKEALHMAPVRLREAEVALSARRIEAQQEAAREKSYVLWFNWIAMWRRAA